MSRLLPLLVLMFGLALAGQQGHKLKVTSLDPKQGDAAAGPVTSHGNRFLADGARNVKVYFGLDARAPSSGPRATPRWSSRRRAARGEAVDVLLRFEPGGEMKLTKGNTFIRRRRRGPASRTWTPAR